MDAMQELPKPPPRITLLTDFGPKDTYIGVMKGVIATVCPHAVIEDLSHGIAPQDVHEGAFLLAQSYSYFPPGTIHVAVVDPGVGGERSILGLEIDGFRFLAPDNGLLGGVLSGRTPDQVVRVENERFFLQPVSATFHGRDIFAPVAAHLAMGVPLGELGPVHEGAIEMPWPLPRSEGGYLRGEVIHVDHFGNCITNLRASQVDAGTVTCNADAGERRIPVAHHYSAVAVGGTLALAGSSGYVEISVRDGHAADQLGIKRGDPVTWGDVE